MSKVAVLAIEDDRLQFALIQRLLRDGLEGNSYQVESATTLASAFERLDQTPPIHLVLLDLGLPGSSGIETVTQYGRRIADHPVIILTGNADQEIAQRAIHLGAQDYLDKSELTEVTLQRAIRYALERHALKRELEQARYEREMKFVDEAAPESPVTSRLYGQRSLRAAAPSTFEQLVEAYAASLADAVDQRAFRVEHRVSDRLKVIAQTLGRLVATPRDVVEIHTQALRERGGVDSAQKQQTVVEESRFLLLELVGNLCAFYRRQSIGAADDGAGAQRLAGR